MKHRTLSQTSIFLRLGGIALLLSLCLPVVRADKEQMDQLVPDVPYVRKADRTYIFSRAQWKYGLQRSDYLNKWIDQPLFVDPELEDNRGHSLTLPSFQSIQRTVIRYGLDGMGFFPQTSQRTDVYERVKESGIPGFHIVTEFVSEGTKISYSDTLRLALENPYSQRINGKVIILSYGAESNPPQWWADELKSLRSEHGDTFIFLPSLGRFLGRNATEWVEKYHGNAVTADEIKLIKEELRHWLRATDGLYVSSITSFRFSDRKFDEDFYRHFVIRLFKSVLAEPEFADKYFGLSAMLGHENCTRLGSTFSCDATKTLRRSLQTALNAHPDVIDMSEWDEQNENTSVRPTVYNGTSTERILRYFTSQQKGERLTPVPSDNLDLPNLIVSYRKLLVLGESLDIELLDIPDSDSSLSYTVALTLTDPSGKSVYTSPVQKFSGDTMRDQTLTIPSESLAACSLVRPRLEIEFRGQKITVENGLHYIELRPSWNWDYKWVKQPLRDLLKPSKAEFSVGPISSDGSCKVDVDFEVDEPLAYVQILDNDNIVHIAPPDGDHVSDVWRETEDQYVISIAWQSLHSYSKALMLNGHITLKNADAHWLLPTRHGLVFEGDSVLDGIPVSRQPSVTFKKIRSSNWIGRIFLAISRAQIANAELEIDLGDLYRGTVPLQRLIDQSIFGIPGPEGFNLVISRYLRQDNMPKHLKTRQAQYSTLIRPDLPNSVVHLQAISRSGRIYRSAPIVLGKPSEAESPIKVYSDAEKQAVTVKVDSARIPEIQYDFNPDRGSVLTTKSGRPFWGIFGGYFTQATERGGGESNDGSPFLNKNHYPAGVSKGAPDWVKTEDGADALQFDGQGTYVTLPQGVIPRRGSWTIELDVKPESVTERQFLIGNRNFYMGSLIFLIEKGTIRAEFTGQYSGSKRVDSQVAIPAGQWSHVRLRYDQKDLFVSVNGEAGKPIPIAGPGIYDTLSVLGGFQDAWFKGQIKSLRIRHSAE